MSGPKFSSVDEYIASMPDTAQAALMLVRETIKKALPGADETISYNLPAYKLDGTIVIYFAGWKGHYSVYPADANVVTAFKSELAGYQVEKGTIRFPYEQAVPVKLLKQITKLRAAIVNERRKVKASKHSGRSRSSHS